MAMAGRRDKDHVLPAAGTYNHISAAVMEPSAEQRREAELILGELLQLGPGGDQVEMIKLLKEESQRSSRRHQRRGSARSTMNWPASARVSSL